MKTEEKIEVFFARLQKLGYDIPGKCLLSLKTEEKIENYCYRYGEVTTANEANKDLLTLNAKLMEQYGAKVVLQSGTYWASVWACLGYRIPPISYLHAENFFGEIRCTGDLFMDEFAQGYAEPIAKQIAAIYEKSLPYKPSAVLVYKRGPVLWGETLDEVLDKALALEEVAKLAYHVTDIAGINNKFLSYGAMEKAYLDK